MRVASLFATSAARPRRPSAPTVPVWSTGPTGLIRVRSCVAIPTRHDRFAAPPAAARGSAANSKPSNRPVGPIAMPRSDAPAKSPLRACWLAATRATTANRRHAQRPWSTTQTTCHQGLARRSAVARVRRLPPWPPKTQPRPQSEAVLRRVRSKVALSGDSAPELPQLLSDPSPCNEPGSNQTRKQRCQKPKKSPPRIRVDIGVCRHGQHQRA